MPSTGNTAGTPAGANPVQDTPSILDPLDAFGAGGSGIKVATSGIVGGPFSSISKAITSTLDLLKLMAWLFDPKNWLRSVEFVAGIILIGFGFWAAVQSFGERRERYAPDEDVISRSGLGRVASALASSEGGSTRQRTRRAPHVQRREARRRGMEAATRAPKRSASSGKKTNSLTKAIKAGAKAAPK